MDYLQRAKSFRTKKRLGQNFLVDPNVIQNILDNANISKDDVVVEIGAGVGFVTEQLVKFAKRVIAIELDESAIKELKKIECDNLEIVHQDILKINLSDLSSEKVKIVANIPYYITSPIIAHLLGEIDDMDNKNRKMISDIILMVQYEVAQRIVATEKSPSKQYGLLTILSQFWAECEIVKKIGSKCFYPRPKVDSALIKFSVREKPLLELSDYSHFRKTIKAAFSQRRKNIKNCLLAGGFLKESIQKSLEKLGFSENIRGETISIEDFGKLSQELLHKFSPEVIPESIQDEQAGKMLKQVQHNAQCSKDRQIKVKCPAKINLTLEVLNKREDGFHNIQSVMQTIDLFDILTIKVEKSEDFQIKLSGTSDEIPYDEKNLVYKAVELFMRNLLASKNYIVSIHIEKNIPVAAGLAGGSTDAAGALWGLNKLFDDVFSDEELHNLCSQLGSDLNFCLEGGCQLAKGRGEFLEKLPFIEFSLSLIKPKALGISAKEAYTKFSQLENKPSLDMTSKLVDSLKNGNSEIQKFLHNDLETAVFNDYPQLQKIKSALPESIMSGSGSTYFILKENIQNIDDKFWVKTNLKSFCCGVSEL